MEGLGEIRLVDGNALPLPNRKGVLLCEFGEMAVVYRFNVWQAHVAQEGLAVISSDGAHNEKISAIWVHFVAIGSAHQDSLSHGIA